MALGAAAAASLAWWRTSKVGDSFAPESAASGAQQQIINIIREQLPYLQHSKSMRKRFTDDWLAHPSYARIAPSAGTRLLIHTYLLSTDFFINSIDERKPLNYTALYDPYSVACVNPFADLSFNSG